MDAKIGDWVVTPRTGKPVEVQALWINALHVGAALCSRALHWRAVPAGTRQAAHSLTRPVLKASQMGWMEA